jgi:hypothetical protein
VDVDELLPDELAHFQVAGDDAQRAEIAAWLGPDVRTRPTSSGPGQGTPAPPHPAAPNMPRGNFPHGTIGTMGWTSEGQRLLAAVLERMTGEEVAARCHVDPSTVSRWRSGDRVPRDYRHRAALAELGIPMGDWDRAPQPVAA